MHFQIRFRNVPEESRERIRESIRQAADKELEPRLSSFRDDLVRLHASVERNSHHEHLYRVALRLELPRKVLIAREQDYDLLQALSRSVGELGRRLERYLHRLHGETSGGARPVASVSANSRRIWGGCRAMSGSIICAIFTTMHLAFSG